MKTKIIHLVVIAAAVGLALPLGAAPLTQSTFTEVIKDVNVVDASTHASAPAKDNDLLQAHGYGCPLDE